ncbi:MAG: YgaP family membrane protein [Smithellaceae bacterium]
MERNVGTIDRIARLVVAILIIAANVMGWITGIVGLVLAVLAGMLLSSVISGHCPLYAILGIRKTI